MVIDQIILTQYIVTALSSGFNAVYFLSYRSPLRRRRTGALALALLSVAILIESLYFTCFSLFYIYKKRFRAKSSYGRTCPFVPGE